MLSPFLIRVIDTVFWVLGILFFVGVVYGLSLVKPTVTPPLEQSEYRRLVLKDIDSNGCKVYDMMVHRTFVKTVRECP